MARCASIYVHTCSIIQFTSKRFAINFKSIRGALTSLVYLLTKTFYLQFQISKNKFKNIIIYLFLSLDKVGKRSERDERSQDDVVRLGCAITCSLVCGRSAWWTRSGRAWTRAGRWRTRRWPRRCASRRRCRSGCRTRRASTTPTRAATRWRRTTSTWSACPATATPRRRCNGRRRRRRAAAARSQCNNLA